MNSQESDSHMIDLTLGSTNPQYVSMEAVPSGDLISPPLFVRPMTASEIAQQKEREIIKERMEYEQSEEFFVEKMKALIDMDDYESAHGKADDLLCEFLRLKGYGDLVDAWEDVPKWYA